MINKLAEAIHENAKAKGFYEEEKNVGEMIALMHSELSEALEAHRAGKECTTDIKFINAWVTNHDFKASYTENVKGTIEEEMADIFIRVLDFCAFMEIDLQAHVEAKMRYNSLRPHKHGKKY